MPEQMDVEAAQSYLRSRKGTPSKATGFLEAALAEIERLKKPFYVNCTRPGCGAGRYATPSTGNMIVRVGSSG